MITATTLRHRHPSALWGSANLVLPFCFFLALGCAGEVVAGLLVRRGGVGLLAGWVRGVAPLARCGGGVVFISVWGGRGRAAGMGGISVTGAFSGVGTGGMRSAWSVWLHCGHTTMPPVSVRCSVEYSTVLPQLGHVQIIIDGFTYS